METAVGLRVTTAPLVVWSMEKLAAADVTVKLVTAVAPKADAVTVTAPPAAPATVTTN